MNTSIDISKINEQITLVDLFICSASFEERACSISKMIDKHKVVNTLLVFNKDESGCFENNLNILQQEWVCKNNCLGVSFKSPSNIADVLGMFFEKYFETERDTILLDCTTFTHEGLLIILRFLENYKNKFKKLKIVYVCAEEYSFDKTNESEKWLTKGIRNITTVLGYPGIFLPSKRNHLVILFGFELDRTIKLIEKMDFDRITLCFGSEKDSIDTKHYIINKKRHEEIIEIYPNAEKLEVSLRDPIITKDILLNSVDTNAYNVVIAPMNNKLSTIGVALAAINNPAIQLIYSKANEYNVNNYSRASNCIYLFNLEL